MDGYVFIAAALRGSDFFGKTGGVQRLSGGGDQDHLEAAVGAPEGLRPGTAHHIKGSGVGVGHGAVVTEDGAGQQVTLHGIAGLGVQNVLVDRAVRGGVVALIAAGGDGEGVRQGHGDGVAVGAGVLNGHHPRLPVGLGAADVDIAAEADGAGGNAVLGEDGSHPVGGVALGDAAQIDGAAVVQRDGVS